MSNVDKQMLRECRALIQNNKWEAAESKARAILQFDPDNYNALVFQGLSSLHLGHAKEAEEAYQRASRIMPDQLLAWQGLEKFYSGQKQWGALASVLEKQAALQLDQGDATRCAELLQSLVRLRREHGRPDELAAALQHFVPGSRYHALLATLPVPDQSAPESTSTFEAQMMVHGDSLKLLEELIRIYETAESRKIDEDVSRQRSTLEGAKLGVQALKNVIVTNVLRRSPLPHLYEKLAADVHADDATRRRADENLMRHYRQLALAVPSGGPKGDPKLKADARRRALDVANGMVVLGVPNENAWRLYLDWGDYDLAHLPFDEVRTFVRLFPKSGRARSLRALLCLVRDAQYLEERQHADRAEVSEDADLLKLSLVGLEPCKDSQLCWRISSLFYLLDRDYEAALETLNGAERALRDKQRTTGLRYERVSLELQTHLATAYTHLHPPQHHRAARQCVERVLEADAGSVEGHLAQAYLDAHAGAWREALNGFEAVVRIVGALDEVPAGTGRDLGALSLSPAPRDEAECEAAWCLVQLGELDAAHARLQALLDATDNDACRLGAEFRARTWYRLGRCLWAMGGENRTGADGAYRCYITAIQRFAAFAPAFTALGRYYQSAVEPADPVRASKCFQKAFELEASEYEAAHELVEQFAAQRDWALVDVVVRRVIEAEGGGRLLAGQRTGGVHLTHNPWAWKAVAIVDAMAARHSAAIVELQVALRAAPRDLDAWVRLGEAYLASGRPVAALKTHVRAVQLARKAGASARDIWPIHFHIAEAQRALGKDDEAIAIFTRVLREHPEQNSVRAVLAETCVQHAQRLLHAGYMRRACRALVRAVREAQAALEQDANLRAAWKAAGDACFALADASPAAAGAAADEPEDEEAAEGGKGKPATPAAGIRSALHPLVLLVGRLEADARVPSLDVVNVGRLLSYLPDETDVSEPAPPLYLELAALFYKHLGLLQTSDPKAAAYAWADVAAALCRYAWALTAPGALTRDAAALNLSGEAAAQRASRAREQGIRCMRLVLRSVPHARMWLLLGNLCFSHDVALAQHAYISAIESNAKSPVPWTSLGFLYLSQGEYALGEQAFLRAQTIEPTWPASWVGRAIVLQDRHEDARLSRALFEHAYMLSDGASLEADYGYGLAVFRRLAQTARLAPEHRVLPLLALNSRVAHVPHDDAALHLSALLAERLGARHLATNRIQHAAALLESEYEAAEEPTAALKYSVASVNLGRIRLAERDAEGAAEAFGAAAALLEEEEPSEELAPVLRPEEVHAVRALGALGHATARFLAGDGAEALTEMRDVAARLDAAPLPEERGRRIRAHAAVLVARVACAAGEPEEQVAQALDKALAGAPDDASLLLTRAAVAAVRGDSAQYDALFAQHANAGNAAATAASGAAPEPAAVSLGVLHRAASADRAQLLAYVTEVYHAATPGSYAQLLTAHALVRLAAGALLAQEPLPRLGGSRGDVVSVTQDVVRAVRERAAKEGEQHWAYALRLRALAHLLVAGGGDLGQEAHTTEERPREEPPAEADDAAAREPAEAQPNGAPADQPAAPPVEQAPRPAPQAALTDAVHVVHLCPWDPEAWRTLSAARATA